jgi:hypothetical protein
MPSEAQVEINTELAQKLQDVLTRGKKRKFQSSPSLKKHERDKKKKKEDEEHADSRDPSEAVLKKDTRYRENGTKYLRAQDGRGVYRNFGHKHLKKIKEVARSAAEFPGGPVQNFDRKAPAAKGTSGAKWPYAWEAHHMIPGDVFTHMLAGINGNGELIFTRKQYNLLCKSKYDVNHGHNIIMLPADNWAVPVHVLLQHPSDHPEYTKFVLKRCQAISKDLQKLIDKKQPHKALKEAVFTELKDLEEVLWELIVDLSKRVVEAVIKGLDFDKGKPESFKKDPVRFEKMDGSPYKWGALY